jgi:hypothetical protein
LIFYQYLTKNIFDDTNFDEIVYETNLLFNKLTPTKINLINFIKKNENEFLLKQKEDEKEISKQEELFIKKLNENKNNQKSIINNEKSNNNENEKKVEKEKIENILNSIGKQQIILNRKKRRENSDLINNFLNNNNNNNVNNNENNEKNLFENETDKQGKNFFYDKIFIYLIDFSYKITFFHENNIIFEKTNNINVDVIFFY